MTCSAKAKKIKNNEKMDKKTRQNKKKKKKMDINK